MQDYPIFIPLFNTRVFFSNKNVHFSFYQIPFRTTAVPCRLQFRMDISPWLLFLLIRILTWFLNLRWVFIRITLLLLLSLSCPVLPWEFRQLNEIEFSCRYFYLVSGCWLAAHTAQSRQGPAANPVGSWAGWGRAGMARLSQGHSEKKSKMPCLNLVRAMLWAKGQGDFE